MTPTLLAVDGNSVLHRCFHASARTGFHTADGRPAWAIRGFLAMLGAAVDRSCADAVVVGFDDPAASVRRERWPIYKAQRVPKPSTLDDQLETVVPALEELGVVVVRPRGLEADDVLASAAAWAPSVGARTVIATSDRDSFALIDDNTKMLRILNGGVDASPMLDPHRLTLVAGVRPDQYLDYAALRGDTSDNLPGVRGFGPKTAARLLAEFDDAESAFEEAAGGGERCRAALGKALAATLGTPEARTAFALNKAVMTMHHDLPLGLDIAAGVGRLPLAADRVRAVFTRYDLHTPAVVRALTGIEAPMPRRHDVDNASWRPPRVGSAARFAPLPKVPEPDPTLF
ncbi:MAG: 5'-3' exonuclease H3TH domain-containing protein [Nocardioides sp.]